MPHACRYVAGHAILRMPTRDPRCHHGAHLSLANLPAFRFHASARTLTPAKGHAMTGFLTLTEGTSVPRELAHPREDRQLLRPSRALRLPAAGAGAAERGPGAASCGAIVVARMTGGSTLPWRIAAVCISTCPSTDAITSAVTTQPTASSPSRRRWALVAAHPPRSAGRRSASRLRPKGHGTGRSASICPKSPLRLSERIVGDMRGKSPFSHELFVTLRHPRQGRCLLS